MGVFFVFVGLLGLLIGVVSLIKPLHFLRIRTRKMGAVVLASAFVMVIVGALLSPVENQSVQEIDFEDIEFRTDITYNQLARTPDEYAYEWIQLEGKIVQVLEKGNLAQGRMMIDGDYNYPMYIEWEKSIVSVRILEDDYVTVKGLYDGIITYESIFGQSITIPAMEVAIMELHE